MILEKIIIENFRGYQGRCEISISDFTAFIGKNDIGKSTIFDALGIFLNHQLCNIEFDDLCVELDGKGEIVIGCVFGDLPDEVIIDAQVPTKLNEEYLLNKDGKLQIHKVYNVENNKPGKAKTFAIAHHPGLPGYDDLLNKKITELRKIADDIEVDKSVNHAISSELRKAIWSQVKKEKGDLNLADKKIQLDKDEAKKIWDQLERYLPYFALFRADRPSTDNEAEVQDPMKVAIDNALQQSEKKLAEVVEELKHKTTEIAQETIEQLNEIDPDLASTLEAKFGEPKWNKAITLSIIGDKGIPLNKRGSGIRRLMLFSFFKAEAKRMREKKEIENEINSQSDIIYAIEEPETSLHPNYQGKIVKTLKEISEQKNQQVMITTHIPGIASHVPVESVRYIYAGSKSTPIVAEAKNDDSIMEKVTSALGVMANNGVEVLVCLEGPSDIAFFESISRQFFNSHENVIDLSSDSRIAFICTGGGTVEHWVNKHYLKNLNLPEFHLFDRDILEPDGKHKKHDLIQEIENRGKSKAKYTKRLEIENYLNIDAINQVYGLSGSNAMSFTIDENCKVTDEVQNFFHRRADPRRKSKIKSKLAEALNKMTPGDLQKNGTYDEVLGWLKEITKMVENH